VRHQPSAKAHASPPRRTTALPLTGDKADNPGEADQHPPPKISRFQRLGWGVPACLGVALEPITSLIPARVDQRGLGSGACDGRLRSARSK
jgi:hypothetical protein